MNKRLAVLEKMVASGAADSFARYALALEYKSEARLLDAEHAFKSLREIDPEYLPQYLMAGQLLLDQGRGHDAKEWLAQGCDLAQKKGDTKALGELQDALAQC
jgi:predicted Zn-dependent protease